MGQRRIGQASLADAQLPAGAGSNRRLERIAGLIDWAPMDACSPRCGRRRPARLPARCSARCCWRSGTSSPIPAARRRWRIAVLPPLLRFGFDDGTLDETTLWRFRGGLAERGRAEALFAELNRQLDAKGLVLTAGTLIDATLVEASAARPPQSQGEVSILDPDGGFTGRGQRSVFGIGSHRGQRSVFGIGSYRGQSRSPTRGVA